MSIVTHEGDKYDAHIEVEVTRPDGTLENVQVDPNDVFVGQSPNQVDVHSPIISDAEKITDVVLVISRIS